MNYPRNFMTFFSYVPKLALKLCAAAIANSVDVECTLDGL